MKLTPEQEAMLSGRAGASVKSGMTMLLAVGRAMNAPRLLPVASTHIVLDAFAMMKPGADWVVSLLEGGGRFVVPTTINAISYDRAVGPSQGRAAEIDAHQQRMLDACEAMGAVGTCSCNPFSQGIAPTFGEHVAWSESAPTAYLNSVIGARSNREGATAIASALTGLTPDYGMHDAARRRGRRHFRVEASLDDPADFNLLGALVAQRAGNDIPVLSGMSNPGAEALFGLATSFSIAANLSMFHIVGVTPEAPTLGAAFDGPAPGAIRIGDTDIAAERARYNTAPAGPVAMVTIGAPHASIHEIHAVADLLGSRRVKPGVDFTLTTSRSNHALAETSGLVRRLAAAGVKVTADRMCFGCDLGAPKYGHAAVLATNSLKAAMSAPGTREVKVCYGSARQCVEAAVTGRWINEGSTR
jgi:predicted aconitase